MGRPRNIANIYNPPKSNVQFSEGQKSKGILDDFPVRQSIQVNQGTIYEYLEVGAGSSGVPSIRFIGDTNTGFYNNSNGEITFISNATNSVMMGGGSNAFVSLANEVKIKRSASGTMDIELLDGGLTKHFQISPTEIDAVTKKIVNVVDPTSDQQAATKKYVDDNAGGAPEGTAVLSTGEGGGTKFLREDGDGTCSWQAAAGGGDVTKVGVPANDQVGIWTGDGTIEGDANLTFAAGTLTVGTNIVVGGTVDGVDIAARDHASITLNATATTGGMSLAAQEISNRAATNAQTGYATAAHITSIEANATHAADNSQAHSDYLLNSGTDVAVGPLTTTADNSSADTEYIPNVLYNTDDTPPAANTVPIGTIYIQYTA